MNDYYMRILFIFSLWLMPSIIFAQSEFDDQVFEDNIQSVRLYPKTAEFSSQLNSPAIPLHAPRPLVLEFDDIAYEPDRYSATIIDRKSTRLNSSHVKISYAVFCLK